MCHRCEHGKRVRDCLDEQRERDQAESGPSRPGPARPNNSAQPNRIFNPLEEQRRRETFRLKQDAVRMRRYSFVDEGTNFGQTRVTFVMAPGPEDAAPGPPTIFHAFPYLPYAGQIVMIYRLNAIRWILSEAWNNLQRFLYFHRYLRTAPGRNPEPSWVAQQGQKWREQVRFTREWVAMVLIAEHNRLHVAEEARRWHSTTNSGLSQNADRVMQRFVDIGILVDMVLPEDHNILNEPNLIVGDGPWDNFTGAALYTIEQYVASLIHGDSVVGNGRAMRELFHHYNGADETFSSSTNSDSYASLSSTDENGSAIGERDISDLDANDTDYQGADISPRTTRPAAGRNVEDVEGDPSELDLEDEDDDDDRRRTKRRRYYR